MTLFGYFCLLGLIYSIYISFKIHKRLMQGKKGNVMLVLIFLFAVSVSIPLCSLSSMLGESIESVFAGKKRNASVVEVEALRIPSRSGLEKSYGTDYVYMPVVEYRDDYGNIIRKKLNYGSDALPLIGEEIAVYDGLDKDYVVAASIKSILIYVLADVFMSLLAAVLFFISGYGFGFEHGKSRKGACRVFAVCVAASIAWHLFFIEKFNNTY